MTNTVVILGGAYAGVEAAHRLLKYTLPQVNDLKVILISKNSHLYWNLAAVRAIVPGVLKEDQYTRPIAPGFAKYPAEAFEFIVGSAEEVDPTSKTVRVAVYAENEEREVSYDYLVVATGTRNLDTATAAVPWKNNGTHEEIASLIAETQEKVRAAQHIVVAGAGPTGVEAAAELAFEYGNPKDPSAKKEVVLLSADEQVLGGDIIASNAAAELKKLNVVVRGSARVAGCTMLPDGKYEVELENGEKISTDLYLPTMGMTPNTDFLPERLLTDKKFIDVDEFCCVRGAENVWAAGDVVANPRCSFIHADKQAAGVARNIDAVMRGRNQTIVKLIPIDALMVSTGRSRGTGRLGSIKTFSYLVHILKGKTLGTQRLPGWVDGSNF